MWRVSSPLFASSTMVGEDLGRRRHQPAVGIAEPDHDFPGQRKADRQQQPQRRPRIAAQRATAPRRRRVGPFQRWQFNDHGHSKNASRRDCKCDAGRCRSKRSEARDEGLSDAASPPLALASSPGTDRDVNSSAAEPDRLSAHPASPSHRPWHQPRRPAAAQDLRRGWTSRCGSPIRLWVSSVRSLSCLSTTASGSLVTPIKVFFRSS